ncbi:transcription factor Adf-1-like [Drosophila santomea]|uniref:transcription factor Adf-1-like n=1 Tax=Drosophila santomea TaxID=129105 RepID=UPI001952EF7B|nr:transcription factor Adf-1-like [Drosophila santomea]
MEATLIAAVKDHPCLYDRSVHVRQHKDRRQQAWVEVGTACQTSPRKCKKRWSQLRHQFNKEVDRVDSTWPWRESLRFLEGLVHRRQRASTPVEDDEEELSAAFAGVTVVPPRQRASTPVEDGHEELTAAFAGVSVASPSSSPEPTDEIPTAAFLDAQKALFLRLPTREKREEMEAAFLRFGLNFVNSPENK